jgi:hypothetical protein
MTVHASSGVDAQRLTRLTDEAAALLNLPAPDVEVTRWKKPWAAPPAYGTTAPNWNRIYVSTGAIDALDDRQTVAAIARTMVAKQHRQSGLTGTPAMVATLAAVTGGLVVAAPIMALAGGMALMLTPLAIFAAIPVLTGTLAAALQAKKARFDRSRSVCIDRDTVSIIGDAALVQSVVEILEPSKAGRRPHWLQGVLRPFNGRPEPEVRRRAMAAAAAAFPQASEPRPQLPTVVPSRRPQAGVVPPLAPRAPERDFDGQGIA